MGTSSSFKGPKNNSSLLPSWANGNGGYPVAPATPPSGNGRTPTSAPSQDPSNPNSSTPTTPAGNKPNANPGSSTKQTRWSDAKNAMSRFGSNSGNRTSLKTAGRNYVRARGGASGATRAASRGITAISGFGGFWGDTIQRGFEEALRKVGLQDCIGKPAEEVFAMLADRLAPAGGPIDEGVTRKAILDSLCYLYDKLTDENGELQSVDALGPSEIKEALLIATEQYIYQKWLNEVGITLERKEASEAELIEAESIIKDFVSESVRIAFKEVDVASFSFQDQSVMGQINSIFEETYALIEQ